MLPSRFVLRITILALPTLLGGCFDVGDLARAGNPDAAVGTADAALVEDAAVTGFADAGGDLSLADAAPLDGHTPSKSDYLPPGMTEPPRAACDTAHPCGTDALCAPDGLCLPRCDHGACVIVASSRAVDQLWVIADVTYLKLASRRDAVGNDLDDAELRRLEADGTLTFLADHQEFEGLQSDGERLYWRSHGKVWRMPKAGSVAPEALYSTACNFLLFEADKLALFDASTLSIGSSSGQAPLRPIADLPTTPQDCSPLSYADQRLFWVRERTIVASSVSNEAERTYGFGGTSFLALVPPHVYSRSDDGQSFFRRDLRDATAAEMVTPTGSLRPSALQIHGEWLYRVSSSDSHESFYLELERWSLAQLGVRQSLVEGFRPPAAYPIVDTANANIYAGPGAASIAVTSTHLLVLANHYPVADGAPSSSLLYSLPLPPSR